MAAIDNFTAVPSTFIDGGDHIVVIPEPWRDHKSGAPKEDPDLTEEQWEMFGKEGFILTSRWPVADPSLMREDTVTIVVQVNGKLRGQIEVPNPAVEDVVMDAVKSNDKIQTWVAGKQIVKTIYVPGKLVNVVVR